MDVYLTAETAPVSYNGEDRWDKAVRHGIQYLLYKTGPVTACVAEAGAFVSSSPDVRSPDIQIHCLPAYVVDHGRMRIKGHGVTINTCNLRPKSIGSVTLRSADPLAEPAIDPAFLQDPYDWTISMEAFERGREILNAPAFKGLIRKEAMPGADVKTPDGIRAYIKQWSKTDYHPVGSCKMGSDRDGRRRHAAPGPRARRPAGHRRLDHADAHQRQHLGAVDHDRREGGRDHAGGSRRLMASTSRDPLGPARRERRRRDADDPGHAPARPRRGRRRLGDADWAATYADRNGIPASGSVEDVIARDDIDAVYISSTNEHHRAHTELAAAAGKHVLCEKPLALSIEDGRAMIDACERAGVTLATNHHLPGSGLHRTIRRLVADGAVGRVLGVRVFHAVMLPERLQGWRLESREGGGVTMDITCHDASVLNPLLGALPADVVALAASQGPWGAAAEDALMSDAALRRRHARPDA